ncbi:MAG: glutathione S-transferase N-terminal domain-containing protein [Rhizomicrobium sp.]
MITVSAFKWVPPFARGQVRDLRVRWELEEAGIPYSSRLIGFEDQTSPAYRAWQPFGQVPAHEEDGLALFESGAIVLHIGEKSEALLPTDAGGRARATTWLFCALNTIEVAIQQYGELFFHEKEDWGRNAGRSSNGAYGCG